jgi:hypothetical protein
MRTTAATVQQQCYDPFSIDLTQDAEYGAPRLLM